MKELNANEIKQCSGSGFWSFFFKTLFDGFSNTKSDVDYQLENTFTPYGRYDTMPDMYKRKDEPLYYV